MKADGAKRKVFDLVQAAESRGRYQTQLQKAKDEEYEAREAYNKLTNDDNLATLRRTAEQVKYIENYIEKDGLLVRALTAEIALLIIESE